MLNTLIQTAEWFISKSSSLGQFKARQTTKNLTYNNIYVLTQKTQ